MMKLRERFLRKIVMIRKVRFLVVLICFLLLATHSAIRNSMAAGEWLPEHERIEVNLSGTFQDVRGNSVQFDDFRNQVLMLNFWATWCGPCLIEMPSMAALHEEFEGQGLHVVAVTNEDEETVRRFLEQNPYPFTFLIDQEGRLSERLRVWALPLTIILDRNGKLTYFHQGAQLWDTPDMKREVRQLVRE